MSADFVYLLDANVVSEMMRPVPDERVVRTLDSADGDGIGLASITVWEILNGIGRLDPGRRRDTLDDRFRALIEDFFEDRVLDWTAGDARACAGLMEARRRRGAPLDDHLPDAMLAGLALHRGLVVMTRNESEFRDTGVKYVNPWSA